MGPAKKRSKMSKRLKKGDDPRASWLMTVSITAGNYLPSMKGHPCRNAMSEFGKQARILATMIREHNSRERLAGPNGSDPADS